MSGRYLGMLFTACSSLLLSQVDLRPAVHQRHGGDQHLALLLAAADTRGCASAQVLAGGHRLGAGTHGRRLSPRDAAGVLCLGHASWGCSRCHTSNAIDRL